MKTMKTMYITGMNLQLWITTVSNSHLATRYIRPFGLYLACNTTVPVLPLLPRVTPSVFL